MTAFATIFALTPMALGVTGNSGFISKPLAIVVIGGLISSTLLTLILVPVLYWLVEGRKERKAIRVAKRLSKKQAKADKKAGKQATGVVVADQSAPEAAAVVAEPIATTTQAVIEPDISDEQVFQPAALVDTPELAWSEEPTDLQIDDESSMQWSEEAAPESPAPAPTQPAAMELPASEAPADAPLTKAEQRAANKAAKAERKAQIWVTNSPMFFIALRDGFTTSCSPSCTGLSSWSVTITAISQISSTPISSPVISQSTQTM